MNNRLNEHRSLCFEDIIIVSLKYAKKHYNCYCNDCREQLLRAIGFDVRFVIMFEGHIIGIIF